MITLPTLTPPPEALVRQYGVTAQMLAPIVRGRQLRAVISVHHTGGQRNWSRSDVAAPRGVGTPEAESFARVSRSEWTTPSIAQCLDEGPPR